MTLPSGTPGTYRNGVFSFARLTDDDLPLLHRWLNEPHVASRWDGPSSIDDVARKYKANAASEWVVPMIVSVAGKPIGFIQSYRASRVGDGWWPDADDSVIGIDQFIGEADYVGRGYGSAFVRQYVDQLFADQSVSKIITDPAPDNAAAIRAYEKAGFQRVGEIMTPDGPSLLMEVRRQRREQL